MSVVPSKPQVAPINAEDYGSGDLDKTFARSKSLRIETRPTRALEALGINAEDIMQQDEETGPADPFEVGTVVSRHFLLKFSCLRTASLALEALGIDAEDIMQQDEEAGPADPFEVGIVVSRLFLLFFLLFSYSCVRTASLALEALGINAEDIMQREEDTGPADPFEVGQSYRFPL